MIKHLKNIRILIFIILVISVFILSFFFFSNSPQPKTDTKAEGIKPTVTTNASLPLTLKVNKPEEDASRKSFGEIFPPETPKPIPTLKIPAIKRKMIEIVIQNNTFTPKDISGELGQIITLVFSAQDKTYRISLSDFGLSREIPANNNGFIEFQATKTGKFIFNCLDGCPASSKGILTVTE